MYDNFALFACGGTIDKIYFDAASAYSIGPPAIADIAIRARTNLPAVQSLLKKDSLDMTDDDRRLVADAVRACTKTRIVITHGTDTMTDTARTVTAVAAGKTIVFTGAFLPAAFRDSDADFNVGFAIGAALSLPAGVYVAMNGRVLPAATAHKNRDAGRFEESAT